MFMCEFLKDPNHNGIKSFHLCFWKTDFALIHLQYQKHLYEKGNEKYINYLKKKIRQRQFWLKGDACGCPKCKDSYKLLGRVLYQ